MDQFSSLNGARVGAFSEDTYTDISKSNCWPNTLDEKCFSDGSYCTTKVLAGKHQKICINWKGKDGEEDCVEAMAKKISEFEEKLRIRDDLIENYQRDKQLSLMNEALYRELCESMVKFQESYKTLEQENERMRNEITYLNTLIIKNKIFESNLPEKEKADIVEIFRADGLLQKRISFEWEDRIKKLERGLQDEMSDKMKLMNKCLQIQFNSNKCLIAGNINQCDIALEVLDRINNFMDETMAIPNFVDVTSWMDRLSILRKIMDDHEREYSELLRRVNSNQQKLFTINLNAPKLPTPLEERLSNAVEDAFANFDRIHCQMMHKLMTIPQQMQEPLTWTGFQTHSRSPVMMQKQFSSLKSDSDQGYKTATKRDIVGSSSSLVSGSSAIAFDDQNYRDNARKNTSRVKFGDHENYSTKNYDHNHNVHPVDNEDDSASNYTVEKTVSDHHVHATKKHHHFSTMSRDVESRDQKHSHPAKDVLINMTRSSDVTPKKMGVKKSASTDLIVGFMQKKYAQLSREECVDILLEIREKHNNSLVGMPLNQILKESEEFYFQNRENSREKMKEEVSEPFVLIIRKGNHWNGESVEEWAAQIANGNEKFTWEITKFYRCKTEAWLLKTNHEELKLKIQGQFRRVGKEIFSVKKFRTVEEKKEVELQESQAQQFTKEGYSIVFERGKERLRINKDTVVKHLMWNKALKVYVEIDASEQEQRSQDYIQKKREYS